MAVVSEDTLVFKNDKDELDIETYTIVSIRHQQR
jgi:hypothetical protein